jgi:hypothetical protein
MRFKVTFIFMHFKKLGTVVRVITLRLTGNSGAHQRERESLTPKCGPNHIVSLTPKCGTHHSVSLTLECGKQCI